MDAYKYEKDGWELYYDGMHNDIVVRVINDDYRLSHDQLKQLEDFVKKI